MELFWPLSFSTLSGALKIPTCTDTACRVSPLPPIMREGLVRLRHAVNIFFLLDCCAFAAGGVKQFIGQLVDHALFATAARVGHNPADRQRCPAVGADFDRHLIVRSANAAGLHFEQWLGILDSLLEQLQGLVAALFLEL